MARMMTEPGTVRLARPVAKRTVVQNRPAASVAPAPATVLGDRAAGARPRTRIVRRSNRAIGREMVTVLFASFIVSLLCLYVSAYARVTAQGFELARLSQKIQAAEARGQALEAAISGRMAMEQIDRIAARMKMEPGMSASVNMVTSKPGATPSNRTGAEDATISTADQAKEATP